MLVQRLLTALVLIPLVTLGVFNLSQPIFELVIAVFLLIGGREWARLAGIGRLVTQLLYVGMLAGCMLLAGLWLDYSPVSGLDQHLLLLGVVGWIALAIKTLTVREISVRTSGIGFSTAVLGLLVLTIAAVSVASIRERSDGGWLFMSLLLLVWTADSAAYFAGRAWGKHKLAPVLSPKKTWEGALGGALGTTLLGLGLGLWVFNLSGQHLAGYLLLCLCVVVISIIGDLFESLLKRRAAIKDSGVLLPGHGGVLDRVDSLLAASPFYAFGVGWVWA